MILWSSGIIQFIILYLGSGLGHIDCGQNCVDSVIAFDWAARIYGVIWVVLPFYFWLKTRKLTK